ncbi:pepsin-like aspartic protease [Endozoicomonas arenosclerae]|uniref:pepsin-like aspartic protease n=1 Tax=Endozoicomonas arenosclerae TaxID=1633495 RepID=UPI0007834EEA|nr:pepsin-like aspartic protease [Endozoicomonas arenosclerae]
MAKPRVVAVVNPSASSASAPIRAMHYIMDTAIPSMNLLEEASGSAPISNYFRTVYFSTFQIGSDHQPFTAVLDTGSANIWIPGSQCQSEGCEGKHQFNQASSHTFQGTDQGFQLKYGTGAVNASQSYDQVTLAGLVVKKQGFGIALAIDKFFKNSGFDGIFGMAFKELAIGKLPTWIENAAQTQVIKKARFALYLSNKADGEDSRLFLGDPDSHYYQGKIQWHPLIPIDSKTPTRFYFTIGLHDLKVGQSSLSIQCPHQGCPAVVDSGTSQLIVPKAVLAQFQNDIKVKEDCSDLDKLPTIKIQLSQFSYDLTPAFYVIKVPDQQNKLHCQLGIDAIDDNSWILGDTFLRSKLSVYDLSGTRVGFATLASRLTQQLTLKEYVFIQE